MNERSRTRDKGAKRGRGVGGGRGGGRDRAFFHESLLKAPEWRGGVVVSVVGWDGVGGEGDCGGRVSGGGAG